MSKQESFKQRIRQRMATTGERYMAARQALIDQSASARGRVWVSQPEVSDDAVLTATGRGWDDWCDLIDSWPGRVGGHTAIAAYLIDDVKVDPWWAQMVTGGYERITGLRLPHQRPDGTFTASRSKTVAIDAEVLRNMLFNDDDRADLFGGEPTELRSKPSSKSIRLGVGPGVALISLEPKPDDRTRVAIEHSRLPDFDDVAEWKFYWGEWLDALELA